MLSSCRLVFDAAGASNCSQAVVWIPSPTDDAPAAASNDPAAPVGENEVDDPPPRARDESSSLLVYASHSVLHLARRRRYSGVGQGGGRSDGGDDRSPRPSCYHLWERTKSLRAGSLDQASSAAASSGPPEVAACLALVQPPPPTPSSSSKERPPTAVACAFTSGRILLWVHHQGGEWRDYFVVPEPTGRSVTALDALWVDSDTLVVLTGSSAGAHAHECRWACAADDGAGVETESTISERDKPRRLITGSDPAVRRLADVPVASAALVRHRVGGDVLCLVGTAAPRHNQIRVWVRSASDVKDAAIAHYSYAGALGGHEDWVSCLDWKRRDASSSSASASSSGTAACWLASGGQDCRIRLWRWSVQQRPSDEPSNGSRSPGDHADDNDDDDDDDPPNEDDDVNDGESRLEVLHSDGATQTNVYLEAILLGHEAAVTSVQWHPDPAVLYGQDLVLLSASMDRTILLWAPIRPSATGGGEDASAAAWMPLPRLGIAGGILGGPVGASLLGWCRAVWEPLHGRSIVGHAYGGALHVWALDDDDVEAQLNQQRRGFAPLGTTEERAALLRWSAAPGLTGHFRAVTDLCWEASRGVYLVSVGRDQTCRLWAPLLRGHRQDGSGGRWDDNDDHPVWVELARPQVHGYDLVSVASLSTPQQPHRLITAADEKELRVFDAPLGTVRALEALCGVCLGDASCRAADAKNRVERAYIPSLGLTNKSNAGDGAEEDEGDAPEVSTGATLRVPLEHDLGVASIWPESNKLFGHKGELYSISSTLSGRTVLDESSSSSLGSVLVASSTKARDAEAARIRLWDAGSGKCTQTLSSHKSTVSTMSFSASGRYLVSSGKDRRLSVWARQSDDCDSLFDLAWVKDSAHKRIVWSVHFHPCDDTVFASGSRDGSVKIWRIQTTGEFQVHLLNNFAPSCVAADGRPCAVTALSFAPLNCTKSAHLALGLDAGTLEVWVVPLGDEGGPPVNTCLVPQSLGHGATVSKLAWRPTGGSFPQTSSLYLASSSLDQGVRVFEFKVKATN